ncbi:MAG TPA: hypothetical protein V6D21_15975 [Candidatus Obscuribacterales bacterium]
MINQKPEDLDINELTDLTPFSLDVYQNPGKFTSGNLYVQSHVLESAAPLNPWSNDSANELDSGTSTQIDS